VRNTDDTQARPRVEFDHFAQESLQASTDAWRTVREQCPVAWTDANGGHWVLSGYAEVSAAFRDWETFSSARTDPRYSSVTLGDSRIPLLVPEELDPPEWFPRRRVLSELLSPTAVQRLQPRIAYWVTHSIDAVIEAGSCELVHDVICPVPAAVTLEMLGFPREDWGRLSGTFHAVASVRHGTPEFEQAVEDMAWVSGRVHEELEDRRRSPRGDGLSFIVTHEIEGGPIDDRDAEGLAFMAIAGGVDTTTALTASALVHLSRFPEHRQLLIDRPDLIDSATEEFLRLYPPARTHARTVVRDVEVGGARMCGGDRVLLSEAAACRDPQAFDGPDEFVADRFPNRHIAFGVGMHRCPGSHLARAEFKETLRQLLVRMPDLVVDLDGVVEYPNWAVIGGWAKIPATFTPGSRVLDAGRGPGGKG
jgi:cytochrome P450